MSDQIKHECGVVLLRLLKPISYYQEKYGTPLYGLNKLYLMMEKQHNRGQEGAGLACVKIDSKPGTEYTCTDKESMHRQGATKKAVRASGADTRRQ